MAKETERLKSIVDRAITHQTQNFERVYKTLLDALYASQRVYDPNTPSHELSFQLVNNLRALTHHINPQDEELLYEISDAISDRLSEMGYRSSDANTYQEHILIGSTEWIEYSKWPHRPIMVIRDSAKVVVKDGKQKCAIIKQPSPEIIAEAQKARQLARYMGARGKYFGLQELFCTITVEPLDEKGDTVRDPQLVDSESFQNLPFTQSEDFPFKRG